MVPQNLTFSREVMTMIEMVGSTIKKKNPFLFLFFIIILKQKIKSPITDHHHVIVLQFSNVSFKLQYETDDRC